MVETGDNPKACPERFRNGIVVSLFNDVLEQAELPRLPVDASRPGTVTPDGIHTSQLNIRDVVPTAPEDIPIGIHYHEIVEDLDATHLPGNQHDFPIDAECVWIEKAEGAMVVLEPAARENFLQEHPIAVTFMNEDIRAGTSKLAKLLRSPSVEVDEMELMEGRIYQKGVQRTPWHKWMPMYPASEVPDWPRGFGAA
jgi:hypothetical protein